MSAPFAYTQTYELGRGYSMRFRLDGISLGVEWLPEEPPKKVARKLLPAYRRARHQFISSLGIPAMVVEV